MSVTLRDVSASLFPTGYRYYSIAGMLRAAENGHTESAQNLLTLVAERGIKALGGEHGHIETIKALLAVEGIDVNAVDSDGATALMLAAKKGRIEIVKVLLAVDGIDVNAVDSDGYTALMLAVKNHDNNGGPGGVDSCRTEIVKALLAVEGIDVNAVDRHGATALMSAASWRHTEIFKALLAVQGIDVNAVDSDGYTALTYALCGISHGSTALTDALRAVAGVEKLAWMPEMPEQTLAWHRDYSEIIKALLAVEGIDVNAVDSDGATALMLAAHGGLTEIVQALLALKGIEVNARDESGKTALHAVTRVRYRSKLRYNEKIDVQRIVESLIISGAEVDAVDNDGNTALMQVSPRYLCPPDENSILDVLQGGFQRLQRIWEERKLMVLQGLSVFHNGKIIDQWLPSALQETISEYDCAPQLEHLSSMLYRFNNCRLQLNDLSLMIKRGEWNKRDANQAITEGSPVITFSESAKRSRADSPDSAEDNSIKKAKP